MKVTRRAEYALRALLDMAEHVDEGPLRIEEIARRQRIPKNFLANLLVPLKRARLVQSKKGPEGGYFLARPARRITVGEVLRLIDGTVAPIQCVSLELGEKCELGGDCGYFPLWQRVRDAVAAIVDQTTVADVLEEHRRSAPSRRRGLIYHI
jgi:Rrf2 family transcriptional regulator, cysteine metabolism repressor